MLSVASMSGGQGDYYTNLAREDYYLEGGEPPGRWWGRGASELNLEGSVKREALRSLLKGFSQTQATLIQNAGNKSHQAGWDLTFSAPKSVSVLWSQLGESGRRLVQDAQATAVNAALTYLQDEAALTRRGKGGTVKEPAQLVVATFEHGTSRALDPQLHTHALVMNVATRADGTTGTILSKPLYEHKMTAGAIYRAELAAGLRKSLGVVCKRDGTSFKVAGVSETLCEHYSKRRAEIEDKLGARGLESAAASAIATLDTRRPKDVVPPRNELFAKWREEGRSHGFAAEKILGKVRRDSAVKTTTLPRLISAALSEIEHASSHFTAQELTRRVAVASQPKGVTASAIRSAVNSTLRDSKAIVKIGTVGGVERFTTKRTLELETRVLATTDELSKRRDHGISAKSITAVLTRASNAGLSEEQRAAVAHIAGEGRGNVRFLEGWAGTGKTTALQAAREAFETAGYQVLGVAVAGKAAKALREGAGVRAVTFAMLEKMMASTVRDQVRHHVRQLARAAVKKPTFRFRPFKIDKKTVVIVDEASMLSTHQQASLIEAVRIGGGLLIEVGDRRQLPAIQAGGAFGFMADRYGKAELTSIIRQRDKRDRDAVMDVATGRAGDALRNLAARDLVTVKDSRDDAVQALVSDWAKHERGRAAGSLIFVSTNKEAHDINSRCQEQRLRLGELSAEKVRLRAATEKEVVSFDVHRGDRVLFAKRSRALRVENGETGTVIAVKRGLTRLSGVQIAVVLDGGELVIVPSRKYDGLRLGYAVTTHRGQGTTVDRAYILAGGSMTNRELSYVQTSRAREVTRVYADRHEAGRELTQLAKQMSTSRAKHLAHEIQENVSAQQRGDDGVTRQMEEVQTANRQAR